MVSVMEYDNLINAIVIGKVSIDFEFKKWVVYNNSIEGRTCIGYMRDTALFLVTDGIIKKIWAGKCKTIGMIIGGKHELSFRNSIRDCREGA